MAGSKDSLKTILEWLDGTDEAGWERQIEVGEECRADMERMARPTYRRDKAAYAQGPQRNPDAPRLNRAIPHVRAMLNAMLSRNRAAASEHGKAALAVL